MLNYKITIVQVDVIHNLVIQIHYLQILLNNKIKNQALLEKIEVFTNNKMLLLNNNSNNKV